ncbi:MAG: hypothetical protein LC687_05730 [Actinobacteria bacterium]|nr:hypothetical protein [Actinomycetota bacterium]
MTDPDSLDDLLDSLPPALARKVAAHLAPDYEDDDVPDEVDVQPFLAPLGPCPVTYSVPNVDTHYPER